MSYEDSLLRSAADMIAENTRAKSNEMKRGKMDICNQAGIHMLISRTLYSHMHGIGLT